MFHKRDLLCFKQQKPQHDGCLHVIPLTHFTHASQRSLGAFRPGAAAGGSARPQSLQPASRGSASPGEHDESTAMKALPERRCSDIQVGAARLQARPAEPGGLFSRLHSEEPALERVSQAPAGHSSVWPAGISPALRCPARDIPRGWALSRVPRPGTGSGLSRNAYPRVWDNLCQPPRRDRAVLSSQHC